MAKLLIFILALTLRLSYLGVIPVSLAHDEIDTIIQAHAFVATGSDIAGTWSPLSLLPNSGVMGEWVPLINSLAALTLPTNLFTAHLTTAVLSSVFIIVLWTLLEQWGIKKNIATTTAILLTLSPWHMLFSRTSLEQPASLFFYLTSWLFLTNYLQKKSSKLFTFNFLLFTIAYTFGFLTYHGYKFSLPIITGIIALYLVSKNKLSKKYLVLPFAVIGLLYLNVIIHKSYYTSRSGEMIFLQTTTAAKAVDLERRLSVAPEFIKQIFSNKYIYIGKAMVEKYVMAFSPDLLFLHGEANGVFSIWKTGYLPLILAPFLIIGVFHVPAIINLLLIFSPLTSIVESNNSYAFRSALLFVLLNVIAASGLVYVYKLTRNWKIFGLVAQLVVLLSLISSFAYFVYIYFTVSPTSNANAYFFGDRLVANYIRLNQDKKILVITPQPRYMLGNILFAKDDLGRDGIAKFNHSYSPSDNDYYQLANMTITNTCPKTFDQFETVVVDYLHASNNDCSNIKIQSQNQTKIHYLVSPADSGEYYWIYNDTLCLSNLSSYVHPTSLKDFQLESMDREEFCNKWVISR